LNVELARDALRRLRGAAWSRDPGAPISQNRHGERITVRRAEKVFASRAGLAGIEGRVYPHMFPS
jgi:integrase